MDELRARLRRVEEDAAAARILAGGADRDVGEIRTELREFRAETRAEFADVRSEMRTFRDQNNRVLSAMREDVTDLRADLNDVREHMDRNFLTVHSKIDGVAAGLQVITDLLTRRERDDPSTS